MRTKIVWILNLSPDSFSDGRTYTLWQLRNKIHQLTQDGADIIDIWCESTAPWSSPISIEEERERLHSFLEIAHEFPEVCFSVDTKKEQIARIAIKAWVKMINDVSGGRQEPQILNVIAENPEITFVCMYQKNISWHADLNPRKESTDIMKEIFCFFEERLDIFEKSWIQDHQIILDPGMGAFVSPVHNDSIRILHELDALWAKFQKKIYIGTSRKWFLWKITHDKGPLDRLGSSLASWLYAIEKWVDYLRVHDVRETKHALLTYQALHQNDC